VIAAMTNGPAMSALGVGTVFVALSMLVGVVNLTARILRGGARRRSSSAVAATGATPHEDPQHRPKTDVSSKHDVGIDRLRVALAAYGLHRRRRVAVRGPEAPSAWLLAGRVRQLRGAGDGN
jgi:Na+-transporting methylmalonyl-CoA/oxaloacetate decarboxylase gamma subunit